MNRTHRAGLSALAKSVLLLVGVPGALVRLLLAAPSSGSPTLAVHAALGAIAAIWCAAALRLCGDVVRALRGETPGDSSWSRRWAAALAGLLLAASAGTAAARAVAPAPSVGRPAAARVATGASRSATAVTPSPAFADELSAAVAVVGLGLVGAAALARRLRSLRRLAESARMPGEVPAPPDPELAWDEALLAPLAGTVMLDRIDACNRLLWRSTREGDHAHEAPPEVRLVRAGSDGVELLLDRARPEAPAGFLAADGGRRWLLDPDLDDVTLAGLSAGAGRLLGALVPIGDDGGATYLLPLSSARRLVIEGAEDDRRRTLAALLLALRTLPWADEIGVELVGIAPPPLAERSFHVNPSSYAELDALARSAGPPADRRLATYLPEVVVVAGHEPDADAEAVLARVGACAAVVALGGPATERLILDDAGAVLEPLGISLFPPRPSAARLAKIEGLLAAATSAPVPAPVAVTSDDDPVDVLHPGAPLVRLLGGEPALEGAESAPTRDRARIAEVCAYLALHGHESGLEEIRRDVFSRPSGAASPGRVTTVCSAARRVLGLGEDGEALLPAARDGRIRLSPQVGTDLGHLAALAAAARQLPAPEAIDRLVAGLCLVSPGARLPRWPWFVAEGRDRAGVATVVDAAHHLAQLALAAGDTARARWAVERGRALEPASEQLARDLLAILAEEGDLDGVRSAYAELECALEQLAGAEPAEATRDLHDALVTDPQPPRTG